MAAPLDAWPTPVNRLARGALVFVAGLLALIVFEGRFQPSLSTDTLIYHLAAPATWVHEGLLAPLDFPFHDNGVENLPMFAEVLYYLLLRLTGDAGLVFLVQPAFLGCLAWLYYRSARLLGASQALALVGTAALLVFKPFVENATAFYANNDVILTAGAAAAFYGLLLTRRRRAAGLLWGASGVALMLLTKATGLVVTLVVLPAFVPALWAELRGPEGRWRPRVPALAVGIGVLGAAFFWRNLFAFGNPVWPGTLKLFGVTLFDGLIDYSGFVDHGWAWPVVGPLVVGVEVPEAHYVPRSLGVVLWIGWLGSLALGFHGRGTRRRSWTRSAVCLYAPVGIALLVLTKIPFYDEPRYMFPAFYALSLGGVNALALAIRARRRILGPLVPALGLVLLLLAHPVLGPVMRGSALAWAILVTIGAGAWFVTPAHRQRYGTLAALGALGLGGLLALLGPTWYPDFRETREARRRAYFEASYPHYVEAWVGIDDATRERPATVAYAGTPLVFPLFGARLQNRVLYVPLSPEDRPQPVDMSGKPAGLRNFLWAHERAALARRGRVDADFWLQRLQDEGVDLLLLADEPARGGSAPERRVIALHPERFRLLGEWTFEGRGPTSVYQVLPPR